MNLFTLAASRAISGGGGGGDKSNVEIIEANGSLTDYDDNRWLLSVPLSISGGELRTLCDNKYVIVKCYIASILQTVFIPITSSYATQNGNCVFTGFVNMMTFFNYPDPKYAQGRVVWNSDSQTESVELRGLLT